MTFKGNKIILSVIIVITLFVMLGVITSSQEFEQATLTAILVPLVFLIFWFFSIEITVDSNGILSKSLLGRKGMLWGDVTRFTYKAAKESINFMPVGTYYSLKLENMHRQKICVGNRVSGMEKLATAIIQYTTPPLLIKIVDKFNSGAEVDFGPLKLSREKGLISRKLFQRIEVPIYDIIDYHIKNGKFRVFQQDKWVIPAISIPIGEMPNIFALIALLDLIFKQNEYKYFINADSILGEKLGTLLRNLK